MKHFSDTLSPVLILCGALCGAALLPLAGARAAITSGSDGSDGAFSPAAATTVNLGLAVPAAWNTNNAANAGKGVYDADKWAVVYKYASVNIPAGVTVTFANHPSRAPVVWLVQGNVTIAGTVNIDGVTNAVTGLGSESGPGGFRGGFGGGTAVPYSAGFGPGGGRDMAGTYATTGYSSTASLQYGSPSILPLLGGSGGSGGPGNNDGGGGGGAILIVAGGTLTVNGTITAGGGDWGSGSGGSKAGSGGAIRLVADSLTGTGTLNAQGGYYSAGNGRIRIEANTTSFGGTGAPAPSLVVPCGNTPPLWPDATAPKLVVTHVGGVNVPADPRASFATQDLTVTSLVPVTVRLQATNVPSTWTVSVHIIPKSGADTRVNATKVSGNDASSVWEATVTLPSGLAAIDARAVKPSS